MKTLIKVMISTFVNIHKLFDLYFVFTNLAMHYLKVQFTT